MATQMNIVQEEEGCLTFHNVKQRERAHQSGACLG